LVRIWDGDPAKRPRLDEVPSLLEQLRFWVPGTDEAKFPEYVTFLEHEAIVMPSEAMKEWVDELAKVKSARLLAERLEDVTGLGGKVALALRIMAGSEGEVNREVFDMVMECLDVDRYLVPEKINQKILAVNEASDCE
jgi:hypothetical protein